MENKKIITVKFTDYNEFRIKEILEMAGYKSSVKTGYVVLTDIKNPNADKYINLTFGSLTEAVRAVYEYVLETNYRIIL